jgi:hypothetical protein
MQYFVIAPDGQKYGPADIATLNQWAAEGRLTPTTELEDASTMTRLSAASVPGIMFPGGPAAAPPGAAPGYQAPAAPQPGYQQPQQPQQPYQQPQQPYQQPQQPYQQPGPYSQAPGSNYPRQMVGGDDGSSDLTKAWVFGGIGFLCCPIIFSTLGIYFASQAKNKGHASGQNAMIFCIISLVVGIGFSILSRAIFMGGRF